MKHGFSIGYKYAVRQPKRTLLILIGVAIAVMLMTAVSITTQMYNSLLIKQATEQYGAWHAAYETDSFKTVELVKQHAMVEEINVLLQHDFYWVNENKKIAPTTASQQGLELTGIVLSKGQMPLSPSEMVIEDWMADILNIKSFPTQMEMNGLIYTITGTVKTRAESLRRGTSIGLTVYDLNTGLIEEGAKHSLLIRFKPKADIEEAIESLRTVPNLYATEEKDGFLHPKENTVLLRAEGKKGRDTNEVFINVLGLVISGIVLFTLFISIYNIVNISIYDRIRQFGLLRAVGLSPAQLFRMVIQETVMISLIAIPIGILAGIGISRLILVRFGFFSMSGMPLIIPIGKLLIGIIVSIASVLFSCAIPASRAAQISPIGAIRSGAGLKINESKIKSFGPFLFTNIKNPFVFPVVLSFKNLWRRKKSYIFTVITLSLSTFLLIVYSFVVKSDRARTASRIDAYPVDFMIYIDYFDYSQDEFDKDIESPDKDFIASIENIDGIRDVFAPTDWYNWNEHHTIGHIPKFLKVKIDADKVSKSYWNDYVIQENNGKMVFGSTAIGYDDKELEVLKNYLCEGSVDVELLKKEFVIFIPKYNMQISARNIPYTDLKPGDSVEISLNGKNVTATVGGLFEKLPFAPNYWINEGFMVVMHNEKLAELSENTSKYYSIYITVDENADREQIEYELGNIAGNKKGYKVSDLVNNPYKIELRKLQAQVDTAIYSVLACIAAISMLTILNTVSSNIIVRFKELGMLRATGMTGNQISTLIRCEGLFYGLTGWLAGTITGLGASYIIYRIIQRNEANVVWITPWPEILIALAVCSIGSIISTALPLSKLRRISVVENINNIEF
ncbi:ABC transporter permease [Acetivibrio straminisolvens]|jgi:putative ABC transport system permease protein|uniref:ABC transporter permease n=1 Tax=Acetivibrio straminisolvens TaxID=253314 RepID=UPI00223FFA9C|nr:ABC transporter permease [Acetivibrio straminisolvens]